MGSRTASISGARTVTEVISPSRKQPGQVRGITGFRYGDARTFLDQEPFDAVVCRLLLTHLPDAADVFVGMRFPLLFEQEGFCDVGTLGLQSYWPPKSSHAVAYLVGVVRAMKDAIVNSSVTTEEEIGLDTLEQRLGEALISANALFSLSTVVGGWG